MAIKKRIDASPEQGIQREAGVPEPSPKQIAAAAQLAALEQGVRLLRVGSFAEAKESFDTSGKGPDLAVAHIAKTRAEICARRMAGSNLQFQSADEHYHYAVERLNARDLTTARKHLEIAASLQPDSDYVLYAFAAALALSGETTLAYENLKRAIELDPRNRNTARQDQDFSSVAHNPMFSPLLFPNKGQSI